MINRLNAINETIHHELSILLNEISQPEWGMITIKNVQISPDIKQARVWITGNKLSIKKLNKIAYEIRQKIKPRLRLKYIPTFTFLPDTGEIDRVEEILEKI